MRYLRDPKSQLRIVFKTIEDIQKKPEAERKKIVFLSAGLITLIIFLVWISALGMRFRTGSVVYNAENKKDTPGPAAVLKSSLFNVLDDAKDSF